MDMDALSAVEFGNIDSLQSFLFENAMQHRLFAQTLADAGYTVPQFPLSDADPANLDDWLLSHQVEHQALANLLSLGNPFDLLDANWNIESQFNDFLSQHLFIHEQIAARLGFSS